MEDTTRASLAHSALTVELKRRTAQGWQIVNQTETTAQLKRTRGGLGCGVIGFVVLPLIAGFLLHNLFYVIAVLGLIVVAAALAFRRDDLLFLDGYTLLEKPKS